MSYLLFCYGAKTLAKVNLVSNYQNKNSHHPARIFFDLYILYVD